jgi:uncharacterized membrane protein
MMQGYWGRPGVWVVGHHWTGAGIAGMVLMLILWIAVIAAIVLAIRVLVVHSRRGRLAAATPWTMAASGASPQTMMPGPGVAPANLLTILEERYARGEIRREDFLQRKQDLGLGAPAETSPPATT